MAVTRGTLAIVRNLRRDIGVEVDSAVRTLTSEWVDAWDGLAPAWQAAADELVAAAVRDGRWPRPVEILRMGDVDRAMRGTIAALDKLAERTETVARAGADRVVQLDAEREARIIASQAPDMEAPTLAQRVTQQTGSVEALRESWALREDARGDVQLLAQSRIRTDAVNVITARTGEQIHAAALPLAPQAVDSMRRELIRGIDVGANPREAAGRMVALAETGFNGGLTRALTISRTEMLDAYRATSHTIHNANADIVPGWQWLASYDARVCPSCLSLSGTQYPASEPGPQDHQQGRCTRLPVLASWAELGITAPEPPSAFPDAQEWFARQPRAVQLQIMGPTRLGLYRDGRVGWGDLSTVRQTPAWRTSRVPTPVRDLQRRANQGRPPTPGPTSPSQLATPRPRPTTPTLRTGAGIGRDITADLDLADLAPKTGVRGSTRGAAGDPALGDIAGKQGFDAKPAVGSAADVDAVVARGGVELYRGVTEARFAEEFRTGDYFPGLGLYGNGTYTSTARSTAAEYANGKADGVARMALTPEARTTTLSELERMMEADGISVGPSWAPNDRDRVLGDPGRYAASKGYDAYTIDPGSSAGINLGAGEQWWVVLNRGAVVVQR